MSRRRKTKQEREDELRQAVRVIYVTLGYDELPEDYWLTAEHVPTVARTVGALFRFPEGWEDYHRRTWNVNNYVNHEACADWLIESKAVLR